MSGEPAQFKRDSKAQICHICEKRTTGFFSFLEEHEIKLTICVECITLGLRWVANQGRAAREIEGSSTK